MNNHRHLWLLAVGLLVAAAACADTQGTVVGRVIEAYEGQWVPVARRTAAQNAAGNPVLLAIDPRTNDLKVLSVDPDGGPTYALNDPQLYEATPVRARLTVSDAGQTYDVVVRLQCFDLVRVGDAWPSAHEECR